MEGRAREEIKDVIYRGCEDSQLEEDDDKGEVKSLAE